MVFQIKRVMKKPDYTLMDDVTSVTKASSDTDLTACNIVKLSIKLEGYLQ